MNQHRSFIHTCTRSFVFATKCTSVYEILYTAIHAVYTCVRDPVHDCTHYEQNLVAILCIMCMSVYVAQYSRTQGVRMCTSENGICTQPVG